MRVDNTQSRDFIVKKIKSGKRVVCKVQNSEKNLGKLLFLKIVKDKPFSSVEVDSEREIVFVEVVNVSTKKVESFKA